MLKKPVPKRCKEVLPGGNGIISVIFEPEGPAGTTPVSPSNSNVIVGACEPMSSILEILG